MLKLTAGLGRADDYLPYCDAGADELFCGYVPERWTSRFGMALPLNRREVRWAHVQIGGRNELLILRDMMVRRGVPVALTFNALSYAPEAYPLIGDILLQCAEDGFDRVILADPALLWWLHRQGLAGRLQIHLSGEAGELNRGAVEAAAELGVRRIILHRKITLPDMAALAAFCRAQPGRPRELEAFALNEMCHFSGCFCNSLHCDELAPACRLPWRLGGTEEPLRTEQPEPPERDPDVPGAGGCALCELRALARIGVTHLKVVGRGNFSGAMVRDLRAVRRAAELAEECGSDEEYRVRMKRELFPAGCGGNCYYDWRL